MAFVHEVVVATAQRHEVVEVGRAVPGPLDDVVDLAVGEADVAAGVGTRSMHGSQCPALLSVRHPHLPTDIQCDTGAVQHDGNDRGLARQAPDGRRRHGDAVGGLADRVVVETATQRVEVDEDRHLGHPPVGRAGAGDQVDQHIGPELIERAVVDVRPSPFGGDRRIERRADPGVGFGVEAEVGVAHAGLAVLPALHRPLVA